MVTMARRANFPLLMLMLGLAVMVSVESRQAYFKNFSEPNWNVANVRLYGTYQVMITVDAINNSTRATLGTNMMARAIGQGMVSALSFPLVSGRRDYTHITVMAPPNERNPRRIGERSALSVIYVSNNVQGDDFNMTVARVGELNGPAWTCSGGLNGTFFIPFSELRHHIFWDNWDTQQSLITDFPVNENGIYWVSARPSVSRTYGELDLAVTQWSVNILYQPPDSNTHKRLFSVIAHGFYRLGDDGWYINAIPTYASTSGAYYLREDGHIRMAIEGCTLRMKPDTFLSITFLAWNHFPQQRKYHHFAYTAYVQMNGNSRIYEENEKVVFYKRRRAETDFGFYIPKLEKHGVDGNYTRVHKNGSYLISLRMEPRVDKYLTGVLYVNNVERWRSWAEKGTASGQSVAFNLKHHDLLHVEVEGDMHVGSETFFSVAFVAPDH